jgi:hypothetical protein
MAITNNGTHVTLSNDLLPSGYTKPSTTTFTDYEYTRELTLNVAKATVENATRATTLTNIVDDATVGIDAQVDAILAADYLATATVTAYTEFYDIESSIPVNNTGDFYTDTAVSYVCKCRLYVKAA